MPDAVGARHEHRVAVVVLEELLVVVEPEHPGEAAVTVPDDAGPCVRTHLLDQLDDAIARLDVDAGFGVGERAGRSGHVEVMGES